MNGKILYSIVILIISLLTYLPAQTNTSGSLSDYVIAFTDGLPGANGNDYQIPTSSQRTEWSNTIVLILQGNYGVANVVANNFGYRLVILYDTTTLETYYILEKQSSSSNHWGMFVYNPKAKRSRLFMQAPHPKYDSNTDRQATYIFRYNSCRALFITGTHRCNSTTNSSCSGTSTVCGPNGPYKISDQAHTADGMLQVTTNVLNNYISGLVVIQPHGFSQGDDDPDVIISNGTRFTPENDYAVLLRNNMLLIDDTLTFKTAHIDLDWDKLIALTNTQGRLINNSSNPCSNNAALTTGRFIHIEQCFNLRNSTASRKKLSDAVGMTFPEDKITVLSPNGFELLRSGEVTPITWSTTGFVGNVKLEYTTNNGVSWMLITASTVNNGTYNWNVPQIGTWKGRVRISDNGNSNISDISNSVFKIIHSVYPTTGNTFFVDAASAFGPRRLNGVYDFHRGVDFAGSYNTPIRPSRAGVIVRKEDSTQTAGTSLQRFGNWILVRIDSANGQVRHNAYLHLNGFHRFNVGDTITTLDTIGFMGKSGYEINTVHLHFELYRNLNGTAIDKDKARNPVELLPYEDINQYTVTFSTRNDSTAVTVTVHETELDFDGLILYGKLKTKSISFNSRIGIDPADNDNPWYNEVFIEPETFLQSSVNQRINFRTKIAECGEIDSVRIYDVKGYSKSFTRISEIRENKLIEDFVLYQNYPNPFNPSTKINFGLKKDLQIKIEIVSVTGEFIEVLADGWFSEGNHSVDFEGKGLSSGIYFCRFQTPEFVKMLKLSLIK
ncbi:MAG: M23 family metallopeptidase [Ignavibacteriales bacterium]|nr:M23 family metallopeptidase [Ignavibacteriales bacterium]